MTDYICSVCFTVQEKPIAPPPQCLACAREGVRDSKMTIYNPKKRRAESPEKLEAETRTVRSKRVRAGSEKKHLELKVTFGKCDGAAAVNDPKVDKKIGFKVFTTLTGPKKLGVDLYKEFTLKQYINDSYKVLKRGKAKDEWVKGGERKDTGKFILDSFGKENSKGEQTLHPGLTEFFDHPGWTGPKALIAKDQKLEFYKAVFYWEIWKGKTCLYKSSQKTIEVRANDKDELVYSVPDAPLYWKSPLSY